MPNAPYRPMGPLGQLNERELESTLTPRERNLFRELIGMNRLLFVIALGQGAAGGKFEAPVLGDAIQAQVDVAAGTAGFVSVYKNPNPYPVAVTILGQFTGVPGKQVKLSLSQAQSTNEVIDFLGNIAAAPSFGKRISVPVILEPKREIFIASADTAVALAADDIFAVRVLDIRRLCADSAWETA